jgi:flagellar biosynthesis chaperone FliJ
MEGGSRQTLKGYIDRDGGTDEDYFLHEYDASEELFPQVLSPNEARDKIEQEIRRRIEEGKAPDLMAREQFKSLYGVSAEEMEDYSDDYKKIENNIDPLREIFERVIASRKETRRRLKERTDQGVVIDPSMLSQAYIDIQSGIVNSRTQLKVCREEFDEHQLKDFEFTLICDLSGSMNENWPGGKSYEQRLSTILIIEALDEFEKQLKSERQSGLIDLHIFTEVRGFYGDDVELKPLGDSIDFQRRVAISRRLENCTGNSTADYKSLAEVAAKISHDTEKRIERGELRKVLLLLTDGGSDNVALARAAREQLNGKGVISRAIQIGQQRKEETEKFKYVWQREGTHCRNVSRLVRAINKLLERFLQNL